MVYDYLQQSDDTNKDTQLDTKQCTIIQLIWSIKAILLPEWVMPSQKWDWKEGKGDFGVLAMFFFSFFFKFEYRFHGWFHCTNS